MLPAPEELPKEAGTRREYSDDICSLLLPCFITEPPAIETERLVVAAETLSVPCFPGGRRVLMQHSQGVLSRARTATTSAIARA
jgi:hypothetical protein